MTCRNCQKELPVEQFELYPTGTRRRICRHCHYVLHTKQGRRRWVLRQLAKVALPGIIDFRTGNHDLAEKINDYRSGINDYRSGINDF